MTRASLLALIVIAAELGGAWLSGLCTNKLFLFFLATGAVTLIVAVPRPTAVSATVPIVIALILIGSVWDQPVATHFSFHSSSTGVWLKYLPKELFVTCSTSHLSHEKSERCQSPNARLIIHGKNLKHARIDLNGIEQTHARFEKLYWLDRLVLDIQPDLTRFTVAVTQGEHGSAAIYLAPQFHDNSLYAEAVFVTSENTRCRLVLHARRSCREKCAEILETMSSELLKPN